LQEINVNNIAEWFDMYQYTIHKLDGKLDGYGTA